MKRSHFVAYSLAIVVCAGAAAFAPLGGGDFDLSWHTIDDTDSADFVLAKVVQRIEINQFTIRTSARHTEVSWLVTGVRQDPYAEANRIPVEEDKPEVLRGLYRHPELYGRSTQYSEDTYKLMATEQATEREPAEHDPNVQPQPHEATAAKMGWTLRDPEPDELSRAASSTKGESR